MYDYFADLIWKLDFFVFVFILVLVFVIFCFMGIKEYLEKRRINKLRKIKENVYRFVFRNAGVVSRQEVTLSKNISAQTFLDVVTNRVREEVFFNQAEQILFKKEYISAQNIKRMQTVAGKSINKWRRIEAMLVLGYGGIDSSLEILKANLFKKDEDISYFSALALAQIRNMNAASVLLEFLKKDSAHRYKIVSLLGQFPVEISSLVINLTYDRDSAMRFWALRILESIKCNAYNDRIGQLTKDESIEVRAAACQCLGVVGNQSLVGAIQDCLKDDAWLVRGQAVQSLDKLLGPDCVVLIIDLIKDNSWLVIDSVKQVLIRHIDRAINYLENIFTQQDALAKRIAVEIIELSGYMKKLYSDLLGSDARSKKSFFVLEGMIKTGAYNGLNLAVCNFNKDQNRQILEVLKKIDQVVAERLENDLKSKGKY